MFSSVSCKVCTVVHDFYKCVQIAMHDCMEMVNRNNRCVDFLGYEALRGQFVYEELTLLFAFIQSVAF